MWNFLREIVFRIPLMHAKYSVKQNDFHQICFVIFAHVNITAPLYFFFEVPNFYFRQ
jgi:hypothetical protein